MRLFYRFDDNDVTTVTASNTASGYKASNLQLDTLGTRWKSDNSTATAVLLFDFGSAIDIDSFAFLGHNLVPGADTVTLKYASDSGITANVVTISHTLTAKHWYEFFASISRQYCQVVITKSAAGNQVYAGRAANGEHDVLSYGLKPRYRWGPGLTTTKGIRTKSGAKYSDLGTTLRTLRGMIPGLTRADRLILDDLQNTNSTGIPFILSFDWENYPEEDTVYGTLDNVQPYSNVANVLAEWSPAITEQG